jgi:hypothetical protein
MFTVMFSPILQGISINNTIAATAKKTSKMLIKIPDQNRFV